jgi:hypothetical protein
MSRQVVAADELRQAGSAAEGVSKTNRAALAPRQPPMNGYRPAWQNIARLVDREVMAGARRF